MRWRALCLFKFKFKFKREECDESEIPMRTNIDMPGQRHNRRAVAEIQRRHGADDRKAAAQARRDRKAAKRAAPTAILFYPWPIDGVVVSDPEGAYAQGPNGVGEYQVVVVGTLKGTHEDYAAAVSKWTGLLLRVAETFPLDPPTEAGPRRSGGDHRPIEEVQAIYRERGPFLSIILAPANEGLS